MFSGFQCNSLESTSKLPIVCVISFQSDFYSIIINFINSFHKDHKGWGGMVQWVLTRTRTKFTSVYFVLQECTILKHVSKGENYYWLQSPWIFLCCWDLWTVSEFLDWYTFPQRSQGMKTPVMWLASMWSLICTMLPSFPHTVHILARPFFCL